MNVSNGETPAATEPTDDEQEYRPSIAVVGYHLDERRVPRWPHGGYGVPAPYVDALRRAGARTAIIPPGEEPEGLLEKFDGLLLVGGGDVEPERYGGDRDATHVYGVEPDRDALEIELLHAADRAAVPTLCVCRGMQVMNVAFGGTLHPHLPDVEGLIEHGVPVENATTMHDVVPEPGSRLSAMTKSGPLSCASHHHQGVDRVGDGLAVTGRSDDGLVEAIERIVADQHDDNQTWMVGVQWHPEETAQTDPAQQSLFDALVLIARILGSKAKPGEREGRGRAYAIHDPDPAWPATFDDEAARIVGALPAELVARIDHVGSTAVPGLGAKPIVDIQLSLRAMVPRTAYVGPLQDLGYTWVLDPWDEEHEYFRKSLRGARRFQIHVCLAGGEWERRHLAFRDWLRDHPEDARAYEALKRELAARHPRDIMSYGIGKTPFIRSLEVKALTAADRAPS
jgi:putative glutamine amidotransferase